MNSDNLQTPTLADFNKSALAELNEVLSRVDTKQLDAFVQEVINAKRIAFHGVGREGLMIKALAMRAFHLGLDAHVTGDMTTPRIGPKDLLVISAGPGYLSTVDTLRKVAQGAGAKVACVTAQPGGKTPAESDLILNLPAQTMANDSGDNVSMLPMGSIFEGAQFLLFELIILRLAKMLPDATATMRDRHTNLE